jgi:hypothetical protein
MVLTCMFPHTLKGPVTHTCQLENIVVTYMTGKDPLTCLSSGHAQNYRQAKVVAHAHAGQSLEHVHTLTHHPDST